MFFFAKLHHVVQTLARAVTRSGRAIDLSRAEQIITANDLRTRLLRNSHQVVQRHHLPGVGPHVKLPQISRGFASPFASLHKHAIRPVVVVEVVDIRRAHEHAQRGVDLADRHAQSLGLDAIDRNQQLRIVRRVAGVKVGQRTFLPARSDNLVSHAIQILQCVAAQILQFECEPTEVTQALNGRRFKDSDDAPWHAEQLGGQIGVDFRS